MKKFLLSLAAVALASSAWAAEYTATFSSDNLNAKTFTGSQTLTYDGMDWKLDVTKLNQNYYFAKDNTKGLQIGSAKQSAETVTISSESFSGSQIQQVAVEMSQGGKASFSGTITVGNYSKNVTITKDNVSYETDFTGVESGKIEINLTNSTTSKTDNGAFYIKSITVTYLTEDDEKSPAGLSFPETEYTANLGEIFTAPELTKATTADVVYKSSKPEVATVDAATGAVKLVAAGKTTITATSEANDTYKAGKAEYTLTVIDPNALDTTFDFVNENYGLTRSSSTYTTSGILTSGVVSITLSKSSGNGYRLWTDGLRAYNGTVGMQFNISENFEITEVSFNVETGITVKNNNTTLQNNTWTGKANSVDFVLIQSSTKAIKTITVKYAKKAPIEKTDFAWDGLLSSSDDVITDDYDIWMPENSTEYVSVILPSDFQGAKEVFNWSVDCNKNPNPIPEAPEGLDYTIVDESMILTSTEAGVYDYSLSILDSEYYNHTYPFEGTKKIYVYPHATLHFKDIYENKDAADLLDEDNKFRLKLDMLESTGVKYFYFFEPKTSVAEAPRKVIADEHSKYTEYNHEEGIVFDKQEGTLNLIVEKNSVKSANSFQLKVGPNESTGVEAIGAEAGEAVYFDLQGRRVNSQPEQGLYIVRKGGKTSKVFL